MLKLSYADEKLGKIGEALDWTERARAILQNVQEPEAAKKMAEAGAWYATLLHLEGRSDKALEWAQLAARESEAAGDDDSLGEALFVIGWACGELGKEGAEHYMEQSLAAFEKVGNLTRQAGVLLTLGVVLQWEGRWDEALSSYERGRQMSVKVGSAFSAAAARLNIAEILTDRGEWAEAEVALLDTLPLWKAAQHRFFLAATLSLLGRISLRLGRVDEALKRFQESRENFQQVGAEGEVPPIDARIAECHVTMDRLEEAIAEVNAMLDQAESSNSIGKLVPLLQRVRAHALIKQGDLWGARDALDASLAAAREKRNLFEMLLTMLTLVEVDRLEGIEPAQEVLDESRSLLSKFKVRAVPPAP